MTIDLAKDAIDLGIVVTDSDRALGFYRDTLGFDHEGDLPMGGGTTMHRLWCGRSLIKLLKPGTEPPAKAPPGGIQGATGMRYFTISVNNLEDIVKRCEDAGYKVAVPIREIRQGVTIAMVEDPDGNWVEFLHTT